MTIPEAAREAVQPSLWDRLRNDLPGVVSEIDGLRMALASELGVARLDALIAGGARAIEADSALSPALKQEVTGLVMRQQRRAELEARRVVVSAEVLRKAVCRDIEALLSTERLECRPLRTPHEAEAAPDDPPSLADFPEVRRSVVNFGGPVFVGRSGRDFDREALAREVKAVLAAFEPRLRVSATRVTVTTSDKADLAIEIEGLLIMSPVPERLRLRALVDLETGRASASLGEN